MPGFTPAPVSAARDTTAAFQTIARLNIAAPERCDTWRNAFQAPGFDRETGADDSLIAQ